jgi:hypothetical protein
MRYSDHYAGNVVTKGKNERFDPCLWCFGDFMKKFLPAALALIAASAGYGQSKSIKVFVEAGNSQAASKEVADKVAPKVGSTSRYALVSGEDGSIQILVEVFCLPNIIGGRQSGVTCDTTIEYWPVEDVPLTMNCRGSMSVNYSESEVAQDLFDSFVLSTTDDRLSKIATDFKRYLNTTIQRYPQGVK